MMLLTEETAKEKWCPFAEEALGKTNCIASECMAWRFDEEGYENAMEHYEAVTPVKGATCIPPNPCGYCGLAGKPE